MSDMCELDRNGFAVVRGFLDEQTCEKFAEDFQSRKGVGNRNYIARPLGEYAMKLFHPFFIGKGQEVLKDSLYPSDSLAWGDYFSIQDGVNTNWHVDHEAYFFWQTHFNCYNFYIPIVKPDARESNLSVVPIQRMQEELPELADDLLGKGARVLTKIGDTWAVYDEENSRISAQVDPGVLDSISITPELSRGDLLLARGDVFHRTQNTKTHRVALSVRSYLSSKIVSKNTLISGGASKLCYLTEARQLYDMILNLFDNRGQEFTSSILMEAVKIKDLGVTIEPSEEEFISRVVANRSPLDRKRLRLQARTLIEYEHREHVRKIASIIEKVA